MSPRESGALIVREGLLKLLPRTRWQDNLRVADDTGVTAYLPRRQPTPLARRRIRCLMPKRSARPVLIIGLLNGSACLGTLGGHWLLWPLVHVESEDIWPCIMANNIQIEFSSDDLSAINLLD